MTKPLGITEVVLRDAHQSLFATRMRIEDMLPIAEKLDQVGYWSLETWGGATFDSCIRFLGEDPWERLRALKKAMPNTKQQMLLRGQNLLGYRHYADDVVKAFVERAAENGMDVFRIFDAMNDIRNFEAAIKAAIEVGKHAQGTISYTTSPVHNVQSWVDMGKALEDKGCHSLCIKDMAGLLKPFVAEELIGSLKESVDIPIALHCHATTGLSVATLTKAAEAGIDMVDTAISSMSMTYGHSPTESLVSIFEGTERDTGLDMSKLEEIAQYFKKVRRKYAKFEGALKGIDSRILVAQVPGGMLTNLENQLREQGKSDKLDAVLEEIPAVRKDLGYIPLVTPTSQIVGTQAVLNVLTEERYKSISKETAGILKGEYGKAPAPVNTELQAKVLEGKDPVTCRPADLLENEMDALTTELKEKSSQDGFQLADALEDDVLTYALFPQVGLKFLKNRGDASKFEPAPTEEDAVPKAAKAAPGAPEVYTVTVDGKTHVVQVSEGGDVTAVAPAAAPAPSAAPAAVAASGGESVDSPMSGSIVKINVAKGAQVNEGDVVVVLEAMKMETEIRAPKGGSIVDIWAKEGESVDSGEPLFALA